MIVRLTSQEQHYQADLRQPIDISRELCHEGLLGAWGADVPQFLPLRRGNWIGSVALGASVNYNTILYNPHGHGTHTECVGHLTPELHSVNQALRSFFCVATLVSVNPIVQGADFVIDHEAIQGFGSYPTPALILRTLPNETAHKMQYTATHWPYLSEAAAQYIVRCGVKHLLIDQPSVDPEEDQGKLLAHRAFWQYPEAPRLDATITEFIAVPDSVPDGCYLLELQLAPWKHDAAPSRPVLYALRLLEQLPK